MRGRWQGGLAGSGGMTATKVLVGINVVVFLLQFLGPALGLTERWSLVPALVAIDHQYYRLFTSLFLHANFFHILFNMWALLVLGDYLEGVVGKAKFLVVYFLAGFGSSVLVMVMGRPLQPVVGASGAIFGLFAGLLVYAWVNRRRDFTASLLLRQFAFLLVINLAINVLSAVGGGRLSWQGHAGGFLTGLAVMAALTAFGRRDPRDSVDGVSLGLLLALGAVLLAVLLLRVQTFPTLL